MVNIYVDHFFNRKLHLRHHNIFMEKDQLAKKIGKNIKLLRTNRGMSQAELARQCFKDKQSLERIENGKTNPTIFTLYTIAEALDVHLEDIVRI